MGFRMRILFVVRGLYQVGSQWLENRMPGLQPFAEVNEFASVRTKRAVFSGKPIAFLFAGRTRYIVRRFFIHALQRYRPQLSQAKYNPS
jgi:hypothetical protein